jgi:hypothetical protein
MEFPNFPHSWDLGSFFIGCFFLFLGFLLSDKWAFFIGILLMELGLLLLGFQIGGEIFYEKYSMVNQKQKDFFLWYVVFMVIVIVVSAMILANIYFEFNSLHAIKYIFNSSS